jgi:hypothetical protein
LRENVAVHRHKKNRNPRPELGARCASAVALAFLGASVAGSALANEPALTPSIAALGLKPEAASSQAPDGIGLRGELAMADASMPVRPSSSLSSEHAERSAGPPWLAAAQGNGVPGASAGSNDFGRRKSYTIPALEIVGFELLLNGFDRLWFGSDYDVTWSSIKRNLRGGWVTDNDPYQINQLGHPYQGSMYHGFARSAGLNYWESLGYTFAGSLLWEIAGETTRPSKNDQVASGIAGSFLGEALFRMANLVLEQGGGLSRPYRELAAAAISPPTGFNRLAFGDRFDTIWSSRNAGYYSRWGLGIGTTTQDNPGTSSTTERTVGMLDFSLDYGLPGKPGYEYRRPFDYFSFQATASTDHGFENVLTRGLLVGANYEAGSKYRGVWGLYGSYDYIAPQVFRISSTALSLGTTAEWRPSANFALQGTGLVGAGYASVGTINGARDRDYHYGVAPQALLALRLIFGDRASLDVTAREYFVSGVASDQAGRDGHDNILRGDASLTVRIHKQHAVSLRYIWSRRDAEYPDLGDRTQSRGTIGIFYTLLGQERFGSQSWE